MKLKSIIKKIYNNNDGVSLIELLISILLLTIIVGAFLSAFEVSTRNNITSAKKVDEGYIAQTYMEDIISIADKDSVTTVDRFIYEIEVLYSISSVDEGASHVFSITEGDYVVRIAIETIEEIFDPSKTIEYTKILVDIYETPYNATSISVASLQNIIKIGDDVVTVTVIPLPSTAPTPSVVPTVAPSTTPSPTATPVPVTPEPTAVPAPIWPESKPADWPWFWGSKNNWESYWNPPYDKPSDWPETWEWPPSAEKPADWKYEWPPDDWWVQGWDEETEGKYPPEWLKFN